MKQRVEYTEGHYCSRSYEEEFDDEFAFIMAFTITAILLLPLSLMYAATWFAILTAEKVHEL